MNRYLIEIAYKGTRYHGWQKQTKQEVDTVQDLIEDALSKILINTPAVRTIGASRTDAGVHARQNFAHFNRKKPPPKSFLPRINAYLPEDILIKRVMPVSPKTHARFDAISRSYEYIICTRKNPFMEGFAYNLYKRELLDVEAMNKAAALLLKTKDFSSFSKANTQTKTNECNVQVAQWEHYEDRGQMIFYIQSNRFLRGMVRGIVGTLIKVGQGNITVKEFKDVIHSRNRQNVYFDAPPEGLYLMEVKYPFKLPKV